MISVFKSYGCLYQHICEVMRYFQLQRNGSIPQFGIQVKALDQPDEKIDHLLLRMYKSPCMISVFKSYGCFYQRICVLMRYFQLQRNRSISQSSKFCKKNGLPNSLRALTQIQPYVTSQAKTFRTLSRFYTDSHSPAVHQRFEWTGMPFERLELTVLKNLSSV